MNRHRTRIRAVALVAAAPLAVAALVAACNDILDTQPIGSLTDEDFFKTEADFRGALLATYSTLLNYQWHWEGRGLYHATYMASDLVRCDPSHPNLSFDSAGCAMDQFIWTASGEDFVPLWTESYKGIMRSNMILQKLELPEAQLTAELKDRFAGEAKFLRAYFYFMLARHFAAPGGSSVPLITEAAETLDDVYQGPAPTVEIWDLIEQDLESAAEQLPNQAFWRGENELGRATSGAANALLGKVRLYRAQWLDDPSYYAKAAQALEAVVASGQYSLVADYSANFREATENNEESVFEIQAHEGSNVNGWGIVDSGSGSAAYKRRWFMNPGGGSPGEQSYHVTETLRSFFEEEDPRATWTFFRDDDVVFIDPAGTLFSSTWDRLVTGSTPAKYIKGEIYGYWHNSNSLNVNDYNNDRVIRYADVLLMLAESKLMQGDVGGAANLVNQVRARARAMAGASGPAGLLADLPAAGSPAQWHRTYLQPERVRELALEGHRYDDLVRWHRAGLIDIKMDIDFGYDTPNQNWTEQYLLKPIPQQELNRNPELLQNPGY